MSKTPAWATLDVGELKAVLARASSALDAQDHEQLRLTVAGFIELLRLLEDKRMSIQRLRQMLFGARTEKSCDVLAHERNDPASTSASNVQGKGQKPPPKGHGRRRAADYTGATTLAITHPTLQPG